MKVTCTNLPSFVYTTGILRRDNCVQHSVSFVSLPLENLINIEFTIIIKRDTDTGAQAVQLTLRLNQQLKLRKLIYILHAVFIQINFHFILHRQKYKFQQKSGFVHDEMREREREREREKIVCFTSNKLHHSEYFLTEPISKCSGNQESLVELKRVRLIRLI